MNCSAGATFGDHHRLFLQFGIENRLAIERNHAERQLDLAALGLRAANDTSGHNHRDNHLIAADPAIAVSCR